MRDTLKIECLMEALDAYGEAAANERRAREEYEGYSWGYFGRGYIEAKESAAEKVQEHLAAFADGRVKATLGALLEQSNV